MAKSPLNDNHLNKAEERLVGLRDKMKDTEKKADESYKESGDSKKTKRLDKKEIDNKLDLTENLKEKKVKEKLISRR